MMKQISEALHAAQGEIKNPNMSAKNPFFNNSKYAPLSECLKATKKPLANHDLVLIQMTHTDPDRLVTRIQHTSGEFVEDGGIPLHCADATNPQKLMSALTYARRNGICAMLSLVGDPDDDGDSNKPDENKKKSKENKKDHPKKPPAAAAPDVRAFTAEEITEHIQGFAKHLTMDRHQQWATNYEATLNLMEKENKQEWEILLNKWKERKLELTNKGTKSDA